jgi:hypothetical protein
MKVPIGYQRKKRGGIQMEEKRGCGEGRRDKHRGREDVGVKENRHRVIILQPF